MSFILREKLEIVDIPWVLGFCICWKVRVLGKMG